MERKTLEPTCSPSQKGFSLVEILVGVAIGLIGVIVMFQVFAISEERKHTTTASGDAQNNAVIALDQMQRDISRSGYGFTQTRLLNCNIQLPNGSPVPLAPVIINPAAAVIPAGDANTDTLLIAYGTSDDQPDGYNISYQSGANYTITGTTMLKAGDRVIVSPNPCGATTLALGTVQTVSGSAVQLSNSIVGTGLFNLGNTPVFMAYAVRSGNLTVCNYMTHNCGDASKVGNTDFWRPIAENVISLRAEYGKDTSGTMDGIVDGYDQTNPTTSCIWARTSAIRFVLVARSTKREAAIVTEQAPSWMNEGHTGSTIALTSNADWQHYRYKVFQTVAPIRNVAWMGVVSGC